MIYYYRRQPYFFSDELLSETGYWLGVCHGWFHLHGLPQAPRSGSEIYKTKNSSCPQRDSNSRPLDCEGIALTARPWRSDCRRVKTQLGFPCAVLIFMIIRGRVFFSCIQYCTHITSVLFCGLKNYYIRVLVHRLNIQSLCSPLLVDCSRIELPRLYIVAALQLGRL